MHRHHLLAQAMTPSNRTRPGTPLQPSWRNSSEPLLSFHSSAACLGEPVGSVERGGTHCAGREGRRGGRRMRTEERAAADSESALPRLGAQSMWAPSAGNAVAQRLRMDALC